MSERETLADAAARVIASAICHTVHGQKIGLWCPNCESKAKSIWVPLLIGSDALATYSDRIRAEAWREGMRAAASDAGIVYDIGLEPPNPYAAALRAAAGTPTHHTTEEDT